MKFENWKTETIENIRAEEFFELIQKNKIHIHSTFPATVANCLNLEKASNFIAENIEKGKNKEGYYFYIRNLETNKLIGYVCIKNVKRDIMKCEFAYFIDKDFEGQGIISKVVSQTISRCFGELKMNKVFICTSKINKASQQIALKHGFQQEGILREEFKNNEGNLEDVVYFGLLKSDYEK
ncbi:MAG: GNAT family protein [Flavobacterium sp.]|uniref:GNAT family N-acetyltransferase n=1 Tax=Flavobacterium sp. TaxID=239 RepID=UPI0032676780